MVTRRFLAGSGILVFVLAVAGARSALAQERTEPTPHELIFALGSELQSLAGSGVLTDGQHQSLQVKLDQARAALREGDSGAGLARIDTFVNEVDALVRGGLIGAADGEVIVRASNAVRSAIDRLSASDGFSLSVLPSCGVRELCTFSVLHVRAVRRFGPVGLTEAGREEPSFTTIAAALDEAERMRACGVDLRIGAGTYEESIVLTRNTRITGEDAGSTVIKGSIVNPYGYDLRASGITLKSSPAPGGIVVASICPATTHLDDVVVDGAERYGVLQHGGHLTMSRVAVRHTKPAPDDSYSGTGVRLRFGAKSLLWFVTLEDNAAAGLALDGGGTRALVSLAVLQGNGVNPYFKSSAVSGDAGAGGVEVQDGALLLMQFTAIAGNDLQGLSVRDGASAHFRYGEIRSTAPITVGQSSYGGANASVEHAKLQIEEFTLTQGVIGLFLLEGHATMAGGVVSHNQIGLHYAPTAPPDDARCLSQDVNFIANTTRVSGALPLTCDPSLDPSCPDVPVCPEVPFICSWCQ